MENSNQISIQSKSKCGPSLCYCIICWENIWVGQLLREKNPQPKMVPMMVEVNGYFFSNLKTWIQLKEICFVHPAANQNKNWDFDSFFVYFFYLQILPQWLLLHISYLNHSWRTQWVNYQACQLRNQKWSLQNTTLHDNSSNRLWQLWLTVFKLDVLVCGEKNWLMITFDQSKCQTVYVHHVWN